MPFRCVYLFGRHEWRPYIHAYFPRRVAIFGDLFDGRSVRLFGSHKWRPYIRAYLIRRGAIYGDRTKKAAMNVMAALLLCVVRITASWEMPCFSLHALLVT
jgi:hypothetical protein